MTPTVNIDPAIRVTSMRRVRLNSQGYSADGTYYGIGAPVYTVNYEYDEVVNEGRCFFCDRSERYLRGSEYSPCGPNPSHEFPQRRKTIEDTGEWRALDREHLRARLTESFRNAGHPVVKFQRGTR